MKPFYAIVFSPWNIKKFIPIGVPLFIIGIEGSTCNIKSSVCHSALCIMAHGSWSRNFDKKSGNQLESRLDVAYNTSDLIDGI